MDTFMLIRGTRLLMKQAYMGIYMKNKHKGIIFKEW